MLIKMLKSYLDKMYTKASRHNEQNIKDMLDYNPNAVLLDLGCSDGTKTLWWNEKLGSKNVHGVEVVELRQQQAQQKGMTVHNFDLSGKFAIASASYDVVITNMVIEHIHDIDLFTSEIYRILKPGGYAIIGTENASSWCNIFASIMGWQIFSLTNFSMKRTGIGNPFAMNRNAVIEYPSELHVRIHNIFGLKEYFEVFNFKVEKILGAGYFPLPTLFAIFDKVHSHMISYKIRKLT